MPSRKTSPIAEARATRSEATLASTPRLDAAYAARPRLLQLRDALRAAFREQPRRSAWGEPAVFFFDRTRQRELEAVRPAKSTGQPRPLAEAIHREIAALCESVEVRRTARAIAGFREAASLLPAAKPLVELLDLPDDETVLVLHPGLRLGYRIHVRGVADANQFQVLALSALAEEIEDGIVPASMLPSRFASACRDADPAIPAGVPMVAELPFQLLRPGAVRLDGTVAEGFGSCEHWLWGWEPLANAPRVDGERVVVLGTRGYRTMWEVERRFPALAAESELLQVLSPFQVAERLGRLVGRPVPVRQAVVRSEVFAEAA